LQLVAAGFSLRLEALVAAGFSLRLEALACVCAFFYAT